jgi:hypothetical protein
VDQLVPRPVLLANDFVVQMDFYEKKKERKKERKDDERCRGALPFIRAVSLVCGAGRLAAAGDAPPADQVDEWASWSDCEGPCGGDGYQARS